MTAIWLLSTRRRPEACQQVLNACYETGMTSPGVVYVDEDDGSYDKLSLPDNWTVHREPEWLSLQGSMQWAYRTYPQASQYGWLADDTFPRTPGWDRLIEQATGGWNLAYCRDLWFSETPGEADQLEAGNNLSSGLCFGGDLVRAVGWWALPGVIQAGVDTAWCDIVRPLGLHRYLPDVTVEHANWRTQKRVYDETDRWERAGFGDYIDHDFGVKDAWFRSADFRNLIATLADKAPVGDLQVRKQVRASAEADREHRTELERQARKKRSGMILQARRQSLVDELWAVNNTIPAARMMRILEGQCDDILDLEHARLFDSDADEGQAGLAA